MATSLSFEAKEGSVTAVSIPRPVERPGTGRLPYIDLPCSLLVRELGAIVAGPIHRTHLRGPLGSIVEASPEAAAAIDELGPAILQVYACLLEHWQLRHPGQGIAVCTLPQVLRRLERREGRHGGYEPGQRRQIALAARSLAQLDFVAGPKGADASGAPIELLDETGRTLVFRPARSWLVPPWQMARMSRGLYKFHPRNDRYKILLLWHLGLMLRINRKHGYRYRVSLGRLLQGAGIGIPERNRGRFLGSIQAALDSLPGIAFRGPRFTLFAADELLASICEFELTAPLVGLTRQPAHAGAPGRDMPALSGTHQIEGRARPRGTGHNPSPRSAP
jgi:hypothetical protein